MSSHLKRSKKLRDRAYMKAVQAWEGKKKLVTLTDTGNMLSALTVIDSNESDGTVTIGFSNAEAADIAYFHNVSGAGKGRALRKFLGLTPDQSKELMKEAGLLLLKDQIFIRGLHDALK